MVNQAIREYLERIEESIEYGAYETAELYAQNLVNFLNKYNNSDDSPEVGINDYSHGSYDPGDVE